MEEPQKGWVLGAVMLLWALWAGTDLERHWLGLGQDQGGRVPSQISIRPLILNAEDSMVLRRTSHFLWEFSAPACCPSAQWGRGL